MKPITFAGPIVDFGACLIEDSHVFRVEIPPSKNDPVVIVEDYHYQANQERSSRSDERVILSREVWLAISDVARQDFNERLKARKIAGGRWKVGVNFVDRLLGKELCVLAWAAEKATEEEVLIITRKWLSLRPEERWWLYGVTAAEAGHPQDHERGWRKALRLALSDGERPSTRPLARVYVRPVAKARPQPPQEADLFSIPVPTQGLPH